MILVFFEMLWDIYFLGFMLYFGWRMYVTWNDGIFKAVNRPTYETPIGAIVWPMSLWKILKNVKS